MQSKNDNFYLNNPALPTEKTEFEWTAEMLKDLKKCEKDIITFAEKFFYIVNLDRGKEVIKLYKAQKRVLKSLVRNNRVVLLSSRQAGKTTLVTIFALWFTCFNKDKSILIVANKEKTAIEILGRIRVAYEMLPNWIKPGVKDYSKTNIVFANDSRIYVSTTASTAGRSSSINCLLIDEAAHIDRFKEDEFVKSIMPVISSSKKTKIFMISTPNGTSNHFYKTYSGAERGENGWNHEKIDWWEVPGRDEQWKQDAISDLGSIDAFNQEYGNLFIETGETAINKEIIAEFRTMAKLPEIFNSTEYKVWESPDPKGIYVMGLDVSDGVGGAASCIQGLNVTDLTNITQAFTYWNKFLDTSHFALEAFNIAKQWGKPHMLIERNNMGGEVINYLRGQPYNYERLVGYDSKTGIEYD